MSEKYFFRTSRAGLTLAFTFVQKEAAGGGGGESVRSNMWEARVSVGSSVAARNGRNSLLAPVCAVGPGGREGGREERQ